MKKQLTLAITLLSFIGFSQSATFSTIPSAVNGSINICAGSTVLFNSTVAPLSLNAPAVYAWDFGNGQNSGLPGPIGITYANPGTYTVTYNISSAGTPLTQTSVTVNVAAAPAVVPTIGPGTACTQMTVINGIPVYQATGNNCQCPQYGPGPIVSLTNANTLPAGTSATVHWGAVGTGQLTNTFPIGTSNLLNPPNSFPGQQSGVTPASHYNSPGAYNMVYMVTMPNGCVYSYYCIMSYGGGVISLGTLTAQTQCNPLLYNLTFANQTPGNTYVINWGDGTANTTFVYPNLPLLPNGIPHSYAPSPCTNGVPQSYNITVSATNSCVNSGTSSTIGPFNVSALPNAAFTSSIGTCICQNQNITFTNTSYGGLSILNNTCNNNYNFGWNINSSPATSGAGYAVTAGTMGDPLNITPVNGSNQLSVQFTQPGTYSISLEATNAACGGDIETQTVTVNNCQNPNILFVCPIPNNQSICSGSTTTPVIWNSNQLNTTTTWTISPNPNIVGVLSSGNGTIPPMTLTNTTNIPQNVVFTATSSANGLTATNTHTITVNPSPTIGIFNPITVCPSATITPPVFVSTPNGANFTWSNSNVQIGLVSSGSGQISSWTAPANNSNSPITGTVTVTPAYNGCVGTANNFQITINPTPIVTNNNLAQSICSGTNSTAVTWTSNYAGATYLWTGIASAPTVTGFTFSGNGNLPSMVINNSSNFIQTITYSVSTSQINGCTGQAISYTITINPFPQSTLSPNQTICSGTTTQATTNSNSVIGGSYSYALQNAAGTPPNINGYPTNGIGQIPPATITNSGGSPYILNYTITPFAYSCSGTALSYAITVNPLPTVSAGNNQTVCNGEPVTLTATGATSYTWNNGVQNGVSFTPNSTQTYIVTGTDTYGCQKNDTVEILLNYLPIVPTILIENNNNLSILNQGNCSYQWVFCNTGFAIAGAVDTLFTPSTNGVYAVQITNSCGTTTSQCITIDNLDLLELYSSISIFPNPTATEITIISYNSTNEKYTLYDQMGRVISTGTLDVINTTISLRHLSKGIYILKIEGVYEQKVVIKEG